LKRNFKSSSSSSTETHKTFIKRSTGSLGAKRGVRNEKEKGVFIVKGLYQLPEK
jgi:hypothetical protein